MTSNSETETQEIPVATYTTEEGYVITLPMTMTPSPDHSVKAIDVLPQDIIPIVFIPGIMGTNLVKSDDNGQPTQSQVWVPPNSFWQSLHAANEFWSKDASERRRQLDPGKTTVFYDGDIDTEGVITSEEAHRRGWGALVQSFYQPMLAFMQRQLNAIMYHGEMEAWWHHHAGYSPTAYGDVLHSDKLTLSKEDGPSFGDIDYAAHHYRFEVWAAGYNWLQSNLDSAKHIRDYIDNTVLAAYKELPDPPDKVVIVTHSMGGLTSRALTEALGYDKVLGVVHGAQPANGAPAFYHHMRAGYTGATQIVTGRDAAEVTAVGGNAPGALELLPFVSYNRGQPWLKLETVDGRQQPLMSGNPYGEGGIYRSRKWYGLVPSVNRQWVKPREPNTVAPVPQSSALNLPDSTSSSTDFSIRIKDVETFQSQIDGKYYAGTGDKTYGFYGNDVSESYFWGLFSTQCTSLREIVWQADGPLGADDPNHLDVSHDDGNGTLTLANGTHLTIQEPDAPGDGTVPYVSGSAGTLNFNAAFSIGRFGPGEQNEEKGFNHADAYNDPRCRWATLYSILKIVHANA